MSTALQDGAVFGGRYRIIRRIASGGMASVYEVVHLETERRRALKVMHPHVLENAELRERFKLETRVAAQVESEFIVEVFDAGVDEATDMPFLVMELLRGEELGRRLKRLGRFAPADVVAYLHQTALALDKIHRASIVHRDLKPANLFLTEPDDAPPRIKVLDFGIAKVLVDSVTAELTQGMGTPLYMAPEQFDARVSLTGAADVYALGMLAFTLLVGRAYWADETGTGSWAVATAVVRGLPAPASARAALRGVTLPPAFDAWFARVCAAAPAHRFPTAIEAVRGLAEALAMGALPPNPRAEALAMGALPPNPRAEALALGAPSRASVASIPASVASPSPDLAAPVPAADTAPTGHAMITPARPTITRPPRSRTGLALALLLAGVAALGGAGLYLRSTGPRVSGAPAPATAALAADAPIEIAPVALASEGAPPQTPANEGAPPQTPANDGAPPQTPAAPVPSADPPARAAASAAAPAGGRPTAKVRPLPKYSRE